MRPYQFYHISDAAINRQHYQRIHHEMAQAKEIESASGGFSSNSQLEGVSSASAQKGNKEPVVADPDLKQVTSYITQKESIVSSMDVIKFLSETPLDEMSHFALPDKTRKNTLCRELLSFI